MTLPLGIEMVLYYMHHQLEHTCDFADLLWEHMRLPVGLLSCQPNEAANNTQACRRASPRHLQPGRSRHRRRCAHASSLSSSTRNQRAVCGTLVHLCACTSSAGSVLKGSLSILFKRIYNQLSHGEAILAITADFTWSKATPFQ
jgi:hypothetical protein